MDQKITALKVQKRNPNRVNVFLDGEYAFGAARIVAAWLQVGQVLNDEKIVQLKRQDSIEVALQKALHYLSYRVRSENEVRTRLTEGGFDTEVINLVIDRLSASELIKDSEFARQWVENRTAFRPRSRRALAMELRQKGVTEEVIIETLEEGQDDEQMAYQAALRYLRKLESLDFAGFREKLGAFLGRRGFSYGTIIPVVNRVWSEIHSSGDTDE